MLDIDYSQILFLVDRKLRFMIHYADHDIGPFCRLVHNSGIQLLLSLPK